MSRRRGLRVTPSADACLVGELVAVGLAILSVLGEGACDNGVDRVGQLVVVCPNGGRLGLEVFPEDAHRRAALVRWLTGQAFVQDAAERVDVGAAVDGAAFDLLGGDVVDVPSSCRSAGAGVASSACW